MKVVKTLQLTNEWVILVISSLDDVINEIDRLSGNTFLPFVNKWETTKDTIKPDYYSRSQFYKIRDKYIAQARINVGEQDLDKPETFNPIPIENGRCLVGIGDSETMGGPVVEYVNYCYLKVKPGTKFITFMDQTVQIDLNDNTVSRAIKVNQVGYLTNAPKKYAYIGCHIYDVGPLQIEQKEFEIVNVQTNKVVYKGNINLIDQNSITTSGKMITGENLYEMDFSDFTDVGEFFIRVNGVGKSWNFVHTESAYSEVFYTSARGLYHQRCGVELNKPFTNWLRKSCHNKPIGESQYVSFPVCFTDRPKSYERFDIIGATMDFTSNPNTKPSMCGWHDAADWDRNHQHYTCVFDLLYAYYLNQEKFGINQLNIPKTSSYKELPDILLEADFGLSVWKRSMNNDGGISGMIETWTHPKMEVDGEYVYSIRTRWDSLIFSAAAAMFAYITKDMDSTYSKRWEWYATKAFNFGSNPKNSLGTIEIPARKNRGTGEPYSYTFTETDEHVLPYLIFAKMWMYKLTNNSNYLEGVKEVIPTIRKPMQWPYTNKDYSQWINYTLLDFVEDIEKPKYIKKWFLDYANKILPYNIDMPYRATWPKDKDFWLEWGSCNVVNENRSLWLSYILTGDVKYKEAAILNFDFILGANPMGMSWITGLGQVYPIDIQHEVSELDGIADPVPGICVYGVTGGAYTQLRTQVWSSPSETGSVEFKTPNVPVWRTWSPHPIYNVKQCEFTIQETMSCNIFSAAMLLPDNWTPDSKLFNKTPRNVEDLHGIYYLP